MVEGSPKPPVRQACDYCRLRKTKCELSDDGEKSVCKLCLAGKLDCTYDLPVRRRGPPPKRRRIMVDSVTQEVDQQQSNPGTATGTPIPLDTPLLQTPSVASPELWSPQFCSQAVHNVIMQDYLNIIYPLVPVVHRPTFLEDLRSNRYIRDQTFHSFCLAISGLVLGILPNKFDEYKQIDGSLPYPNRREAAKHIRTLIIQGRPADYFDEHTREKWAISYMMSVSDGHFGHVNRAKMLFAETAAICYELGLHRISNYAGLDKIESQLRKKAFWLNFTSYTHVRAHQIQWDSISDRLIFESADAELLMPLEVDDEYITAENILLQPQGRPSVVVGFNALTRINNCLVTIFRDPTLPVLSSEEMNTNPRCALGRCKCGRHIQPASMTSLIQGRLRKVKHVLDDIPTELGTWSSPNEHSPARAPDILTSQYESMKANIHVTHLWVQSLLLERLIIASGDRHNSHTSDFPNHQQIWEMREDICRQLLCLLNKISQANLEPNGYFLVTKTREVAACLLDCPFEEQGHVSERAKTYIQSFADILSKLDNAYQHDYRQSVWDELDEQARVAPSTYWALS